MTDELKPCPFCGTSDRVHVRIELGSHFYWAVCAHCDSRTTRSKDRARAIGAWNSRGQTYSIGEAVEAACGDLPEGFIIDVSLEQGAATPNLYDPDGEQINPELHGGEDLADEIRDFIMLANAHAAGEKAGDMAKAVKQ